MALHGNHQIIMGDLNARTSTNEDYIKEQYESHSPLRDIEGYKFDTPTDRKNADLSPPDAHGKRVLKLCALWREGTL